MYTISKRFNFEASHQLRHLPENHKCHRLHGHSYVVIVELRSEKLDDRGFVVDYGDLKPIGDWIDQTFDHQHLNSILHSEGPATTAEALAGLIYRQFVMQFPNLYRVTVKETDKTSATYEG